MTSVAAKNLRGKQIVILSSIDWDAAWQRHQVLAASFAQAGCQVFFVENSGFRNFRLSDSVRILLKIIHFAFGPKAVRRIHPVPNGVKIVTPMVLPPTSQTFRAVNRYVFLPRLIRKLKKKGMHERPLAVAYIPSQTTLDQLAALDPETIIYDVVDNYRDHPDRMPDFDQTEANLIAAADVLFTTSPLLQKLHETRHPRSYRVHHGVSERFFLEPKEKPSEYKRLCYFGTLRRDIDYGAINLLARHGHEVALLGPAKEKPPSLEPSVKMSGMLSMDELLERLKTFDAIILPYTDSKWNQGITPAKIYECLATGLPVIASDLPGLKPLKNVLYNAEKPKDFVKIAAALPKTETPERVRLRIETARAHSTNKQFELIAEKIAGAPRSAARPSLPGGGLKLPKVIRSLLQGLRWITVFFSAAKALTLITHVASARILGSEQYGLASVVLAAAQIALIPLMLGFPLTLAHFPQTAPSEYARKATISTSLTSFLAWGMLVTLLTAYFAPQLSALMGLGTPAFRIAVFLAALTAVHHTTSSALVGLTWFKRRGVSEAIYGLCVPAFFLIVMLAGSLNYESFLACLGASLFVASLYSLFQLRSYLRAQIHWDAIKKTLPYTVTGSINIVSVALVQSPGRFFLFHEASAHAAGVYSAYFTSTAQFALAINTMLWAVLIPLASTPEGARESWKQLRLWIWPLLFLGLFLFLALCTAALTFVGKSYPLNAVWIVLFSTSASFIIVHGIISALFAAQGTRGLIISVTGTLLTGLTNLVLNFAFARPFGIGGSAAALLAGYIAGLFWYGLIYWTEIRSKEKSA